MKSGKLLVNSSFYKIALIVCDLPLMLVCPGVVGKLALCQPHEDSVLKGLKVWRPVTSAPKAKLPLPSCNGVILELALRRTLKFRTILSLSIAAPLN